MYVYDQSFSIHTLQSQSQGLSYGHTIQMTLFTTHTKNQGTKQKSRTPGFLVG